MIKLSIESIEQVYEAMYQSVELHQKVLHESFYQAYIDNMLAILNDYQPAEEFLAKSQDGDVQQLRGFFEQIESTLLTAEERRKVTQLVLLKGSTLEPLQPNHQLTPDSIGFLIVYLMEQMTSCKELVVLDPAVGSANLLATAILNLDASSIKTTGIGVEIDDTLLSIADVNAAWCDLPVKFFHQDGLQPLLIDPVDMIISDLPIGYYPIDEKSKDFKVASHDEHTYAHHLLMEASMKYLKDEGLAFFLVPDNLLTSPQAKELKNWLNEDVYVQSVLRLPEEMFKTKASQKNIIILQNKNNKTKQVEVLVANLPLLSDTKGLRKFLQKFEMWKKQEF